VIARVGKNPGRGKGTLVDRHALASIPDGGFTLEATAGANVIALDMSREELAQLVERGLALLGDTQLAKAEQRAVRAETERDEARAEAERANATARRIYRERDEVLDLLRPVVERGQQLLTRRLGPPAPTVVAVDPTRAFEAGDPGRHYGELPPPLEALARAERFVEALHPAADAMLQAMRDPLAPGATELVQRLPRALGTDLDTQYEQGFLFTFTRIHDGLARLSWGGAEPPECDGGGEGCGNLVERGEALCRWCRESRAAQPVAS